MFIDDVEEVVRGINDRLADWYALRISKARLVAELGHYADDLAKIVRQED